MTEFEVGHNCGRIHGGHCHKTNIREVHVNSSFREAGMLKSRTDGSLTQSLPAERILSQSLK